MRFYYFPVAPNPTRVRIYLGEKGLLDASGASTVPELELRLVNLIEGEQKSDAHVARNPLGKLPVLELDDGTFLTESTAIIEYLEERFPDPPLLGRTLIARARSRELDRIADIGVLVNIARWVHASNSPLGWPPVPEVASNALDALTAPLNVLAGVLEAQTFLGGDSPGMADCTLRAGFGFGEFRGIELDAPASIDRWRKDIDARTSVQAL